MSHNSGDHLVPLLCSVPFLKTETSVANHVAEDLGMLLEETSFFEDAGAYRRGEKLDRWLVKSALIFYPCRISGTGHTHPTFEPIT